jgi:hypothetical protein
VVDDAAAAAEFVARVLQSYSSSSDSVNAEGATGCTTANPGGAIRSC